MRDDTPTSTYVVLLFAVALVLPSSSSGVDWHSVALWAGSTIGLACALVVAVVGCVAVSSVTRRQARQPRPPRVRRRDRPIIGQPAYYAVA